MQILRRIAWKFREGKREVRTPTEDEKLKLQLTGGELVLSIRRFRENRGQTIVSEYSRLPFDLYGNIDDMDIQETTVENLSVLKGVTISLSDERLTLVEATADDASEFNIPLGVIIIRQERIVYDTADRPLEWRVTFCNLGDRQYHVPSPVGSK